MMRRLRRGKPVAGAMAIAAILLVPGLLIAAPTDGTPEQIEGQVKAQRVMAADPAKSGEDRAKAYATAEQLLGRLAERWPRDRRAPEWMHQQVSLMFEEIEPARKKINYEIAAAADVEAMKAKLAEGTATLAVVTPRVDAWVKAADNASPFDEKEYDRLSEIAGRLKVFAMMSDLCAAQLAWASGDRSGKTAATIARSVEACRAAMKEIISDEALAKQKNPVRRASPLLCMGWAHVYNGEAEPAAALADKVIRDAAVPGEMRFEAYALKARALRFVKPADADAKPPAIAALDEQEAMIDRDGKLDSERLRLTLVSRILRANAIVGPAIARARELLADSKAAGDAARAKELRLAARGEYDAGIAVAEGVIADARRKIPECERYIDSSAKLILRDPELEPAAGEEPPTAKQLAAMPLLQLKRVARQATVNRGYGLAIEAYSQLLARADKANDAPAKLEAMGQLGEAYYWAGRTLRQQDPKSAPAMLAKADEQLSKLLPQATGPQRSQTARLLAATISMHPDRYSDRAMRERYVAVLWLMIREDMQADWAGIMLGKVFYDVGDYRSAATTFGQIASRSPFYPRARESQGWSLLSCYVNVSPASAPDQPATGALERRFPTIKDDLDVLWSFADVAGPEIDRLRKLPASQPESVTATRPETEIPRLRQVAARFRLESAKLRQAWRADEAAMQMLDAVPRDFPDVPDVRERARCCRVDILLAQNQIDKAAAELLVLAREAPDKAGDHIDDALTRLESDYVRDRAEQRLERAKWRAQQVERLTRALVAGCRDEPALAAARRDFIIRLAKALNWQGQHAAAIELLDPICDTNRDGLIDEKDAFPRDADLLVELGDAFRAAGEHKRAVALYDMVVSTEQLMYTTDWWRALIGQNECCLGLKSNVQAIRPALTQWRARAMEEQEQAKPGSPPRAMPAWLTDRYNLVLRGADEEAGTPQVRVAVAAAAGPSTPSVGRPFLILFAACGGAFLVIAAIYRAKARREARERLHVHRR
ncbi:MAG: hypothetical protein PHU85_09730 [Phycisphaerae bacterium]|nr:hypothetical protein [Phycisphaerae bacterium]